MKYPDAILFIPGLLCDEALWQAQVDYFSLHCPVTVIVPVEGESISEMAGFILNRAPPIFALCAISMGGYVAQEIMRQAPERVSHLILCDTTARPDSAQEAQRRLDLIALTERGKFKGVTPRLLPAILAPGSLDKPHVTSTVMEMSERLGKNIYVKQQRAIMGRIDGRPSLSLITCPVCVIVGRFDSLTPIAAAEEMAALITSSTIQVIEESGHLPPLEQPVRFNDVLENFIKFV